MYTYIPRGRLIAVRLSRRIKSCEVLKIRKTNAINVFCIKAHILPTLKGLFAGNVNANI